jgi:hypothetical protein
MEKTDKKDKKFGHRIKGLFGKKENPPGRKTEMVRDDDDAVLVADTQDEDVIRMMQEAEAKMRAAESQKQQWHTEQKKIQIEEARRSSQTSAKSGVEDLRKAEEQKLAKQE